MRLPLLKITLKAMLAQDLPHDTWLADEDPDEDTIQWCHENGVFISTRKDCPEYHQKTWPRRTRCKEGNLAYFYDHYGYKNLKHIKRMEFYTEKKIVKQGYLSFMDHPRARVALEERASKGPGIIFRWLYKFGIKGTIRDFKKATAAHRSKLENKN